MLETQIVAESKFQDAALLDVKAVAALLGVSCRTVRRLSDSGRMPRPLRLGGCIRWSRSDVEAWIASGCKAVRPASPKRDAR